MERGYPTLISDMGISHDKIVINSLSWLYSESPELKQMLFEDLFSKKFINGYSTYEVQVGRNLNIPKVKSFLRLALKNLAKSKKITVVGFPELTLL